MKQNFSIDIAVDRVTISGAINLDVIALKDEMSIRAPNWLFVSEKEFRLTRQLENGAHEHVAGLYRNPFLNGWRLDTSNHLVGDELDDIKSLIGLMYNPHFTRLDIAFTWANSPYPNMSHRIYRFGASQSVFGLEYSEITGRAQQIQTIYSGKRSSEKMIRYYDKLAELKSRKKSLPENVYQLERLELQLRGDKTSEWISCCEEMLGYFKLPQFGSISNPQERATLYALENKLISWEELSKGTRAKFRKMIKENQGMDTTLSELLLKKFEEKKDYISSEILAFLDVLGIEK